MNLQTNVSNHEIPTRQLTYINREASVLEASKLMRKSGATELLVAEETDGMLLPLGIMTANDIVMRVIALGLDPAVMTAGDIAWPVRESSDASQRYAAGILPAQEGSGETLSVLDVNGRFVGTVGFDRIEGIRSPQ